MKSNELRIGNHFQWRDIASMGNGVDQITHGQQIMDYIDFKEGISLTGEWLEKLGFKFFQGWWYLDAFSPGHPSQRFDLYWSKDDGFMVKSRYQPDIPDQFFMRHIKYIHQVQNLYFALTGEELTIERLKAGQEPQLLEPEQP